MGNKDLMWHCIKRMKKMKRHIIIPVLLLISFFPVYGQNSGQDLKREVTLYNPYKPSLVEFRKRSSLPEMTDTSNTRPEFKYDVTTRPYFPVYTISPIKAASLLPDPLPELYKSYINLGLGNYLSPLAEISITSERSKKGAFGFYANHYSSNGKVRLQNDKKVFAGYMDNDVSLFGKKFFKKNILDGSLDFSQKLRYAYGYDTSIVNYDPVNKQIRIGYNTLGANLSFASVTLDSSDFAYDFDLNYDIFYTSKNYYQQSLGVKGTMARVYKGFYAGSGLGLDMELLPEIIMADPKYKASVSPFVTKSTTQWAFRLGMELLLDKNMEDKPVFHIYPDVSFGFSVVPSYISFFTGLSGNLERNNPATIIQQNPFLVRGKTLFIQPNTDHKLIVSAGLKGNNGIGGNYLLKASYEIADDMLFYSNFVFPDSLFSPEMGNHFLALHDDVEILNVHGEFSGKITDKIGYNGSANWYKYTLAENDFAWNRPEWDIRGSVKYNLRDKIIAGIDATALGKRRLLASRINELPPATNLIFTTPVHVNINLSAEYRYSKILSFWFRLNNISFNRYYEWAFYPSQRFMGLIGFSYSL